MLKWALGNLLVRHKNVLKEEQKLPVDVRGSKTSVLKLSIVEGGKPENLEKNPRSRDEKQQQTWPSYDQNRTQATMVASEHSHHCSIPAPSIKCIYSRKLPTCSNISCLFFFHPKSICLYGNGEMGKVWNVLKSSAFWGNTIFHLFKSHAHALLHCARLHM